MEKILDRFMRYVAIDTQSDENSESQPSAAKELDLLKLLCKELNDMGVEATLDEYGYVMGTLPSNIDKKVRTWILLLMLQVRMSSRRSLKIMMALILH